MNIQENKNGDDKSQRLNEIRKDINFEELLNKYGLEGLYYMADELKRIADEDVFLSITFNRGLIW